MGFHSLEKLRTCSFLNTAPGLCHYPRGTSDQSGNWTYCDITGGGWGGCFPVLFETLCEKSHTVYNSLKHIPIGLRFLRLYKSGRKTQVFFFLVRAALDANKVKTSYRRVESPFNLKASEQRRLQTCDSVIVRGHVRKKTHKTKQKQKTV